MIQRLSILLLTALAGPLILSATEHSGSVRAADQLIPGATVTATQGDQKVTAYTNDAGRYTMDLAPGTWDIQVQMFGFTVVRKQVTVGSNPSRVDWAMEMPRAGEAPADSLAGATPPVKASTSTPANGSPTASTTPAGTPPATAQGRGNGAAGATTAANQQNGQGRGPGRGNTGTPGRGGRGGQPQGPQGFRQGEVAATAEGQQALAAASNGALPDLSLEPLDANTISGSVSQGLSQSFDDEARRQQFEQGRGGRGGNNFPGGFDNNGFNPDALGLGALGANAVNSGFGDGFGGGGFGQGDGGPGNGRGGGGGGGRGGRGPGGGNNNFAGNNNGNGNGNGNANGRGGRGGRGGNNNNNFNNFGNGRRNQPRYNGNVSLQLTNSNFNATPLSLSGQSAPRPNTSSENVNVTFGGPLVIPKLVNLPRTQFTLSYQGQWSDNGTNAQANVPTDAMRGDSTGGIPTFMTSLSGQPIQLYDPKSDPLNRLPLAGNQIPLADLDPAAFALLKFIPHQNVFTGSTYNYLLSTSSPSHNQSVGIRFNVPVTNKDRLNFNIQTQSRNSTNENTWGWKDTTTGSGLSAQVQYSHSFASRMQNQISAQFSRNDSTSSPYFASCPTSPCNVAGALGISGTSQEPINFGPPSLSFTNFSGISDGTYSVPRSQTMNVSDTFSYTAKKVHNLQFGGGFVRQQQNSLTNAGARGSFSFSGNATGLLDSSGNPVRQSCPKDPATGLPVPCVLPLLGYDFADFLVGEAQSTRIQFPLNDYYRGTSVNAYMQDDWRVTRTLSIQLGVRYDYFSPWTEKYGRIANLFYAPSVNGVSVATPGQQNPLAGSLPDSLINGSPTNLSPRIGFAWRPFKKDSTVFRGGYSRVYSGSSYQQIVTSMGSQPPYTINQATSANWATGQLLTFTNGFPSSPNTLTNNYSIDPNYKLADAQTWNFSVAHDLPSAMLLEVEGQHIKGTHLGVVEQPNRLVNNVYSIPGATSFNYQTDGANSIFNGAQARLTRRFSQGFSATLQYIYSVALDDASSFNGVGGSAVQYLNNWNLERGLSSSDQRHRLTVQFQVTSPVGRRGRLRNLGWRTQVLGGWTMQGNFTAASGTPLTATVASNFNVGGSGALGTTSRADATGVSVAGLDGQYFNPAAFVAPLPGQFGNAGKSTIPGLFQTTLNTTLNRSFRIGEGRKQLQFQLSANNVLNHPVITRFGTVYGSSTYDQATGVSAPRSVRVQLRFQF